MELRDLQQECSLIWRWAPSDNLEKLWSTNFITNLVPRGRNLQYIINRKSPNFNFLKVFEMNLKIFKMTRLLLTPSHSPPPIQPINSSRRMWPMSNMLCYYSDNIWKSPPEIFFKLTSYQLELFTYICNLLSDIKCEQTLLNENSNIITFTLPSNQLTAYREKSTQQSFSR